MFAWIICRTKRALERHIIHIKTHTWCEFQPLPQPPTPLRSCRLMHLCSCCSSPSYFVLDPPLLLPNFVRHTHIIPVNSAAHGKQRLKSRVHGTVTFSPSRQAAICNLRKVIANDVLTRSENRHLRDHFRALSDVQKNTSHQTPRNTVVKVFPYSSSFVS